MARALQLSFDEKPFSLEIQKIDRAKIYGYTVTEVKDEQGSLCELATISDDGKHILPKGCVGYLYMNSKNEYTPSNTIKVLSKDGEELQKIPASFDLEKIELQKSSLEEFLLLQVKSVYQLNASESTDYTDLTNILAELKVLKFEFNYRADYNADEAFVIAQNDHLFMLIGSISEFEYIGLENQIEETPAEEEEDEDDFDFGML